MSEKPPSHTSEKSLSKDWSSSDQPMDYGDVLFKPSEVDLYVNKATAEAYIFHGKIIDYKTIDHVVYDDEAHSLTIMRRDGEAMDLGVKLQWMVRAYISRSTEVAFARTENGESVDGIVVPLVHAEQSA